MPERPCLCRKPALAGMGHGSRRSAARALSALVASLSLSAVFIPASPAVAACPNANATPLVAGEDAARDSMYCLINTERHRAGRARLTVNGDLARGASTFSSRMVDEQFFSHVDPQGAGLLERTRRTGYLSGYGLWALGENIGWGAGPLGSPRAMMAALMDSRPHRRNILSSRYRNMGVGVSTGVPVGGRFGATYAQEFGWRGR